MVLAPRLQKRSLHLTHRLNYFGLVEKPADEVDCAAVGVATDTWTCGVIPENTFVPVSIGRSTGWEVGRRDRFLQAVILQYSCREAVVVLEAVTGVGLQEIVESVIAWSKNGATSAELLQDGGVAVLLEQLHECADLVDARRHVRE